MNMFWKKKQKMAPIQSLAATPTMAPTVTLERRKPVVPEDGSVTAEMIQMEIIDRQDELMKEVYDILRSSQEDPDKHKADRLLAMGFSAAQGMAEELKKREKQSNAEKQLAYERKHALKYPGLRFILKEVMESVCAKYGLTIGGTDRYTGSVPNWAIDAIEKTGLVKGMWGYRMEEPYFRSQLSRCASKEEAEKQARKARGNFGSNWQVAYETNLLIAAPSNQMIVYRNERVERGIIMPVSDPIVCIEEDGGYIILAAWGEEGSDPRVFNTANN